jgi:heme oxygenase (biliverdin-IX-beta and delta-forming)
MRAGLDAPAEPNHVGDMAVPHLALRAATAADHERVDAAFGRFALSDQAGYVRFLEAHARALPAVEAALAGTRPAVLLRPRAPLIAADLAALGAAAPTPLPLDLPADKGAAWGMAYVIEGSRLGGRLLAKSVPADLPSTYLADVHRPGEWRAFLAALDEALADADALAAAIPAARRTFALYRDAAG